MEIKGKLANLGENVPLAPLTTFKIGGPARYFYIAKTKEEVIKVVSAAREVRLPYFIFGGGGNLLVSDEGFDGLVIKMQNTRIKIPAQGWSASGGKNETITAEAGVLLGEVVAESIRAGLAGLEWAVGIPGTDGGAVCGNAGAFGHHFSEVVEAVEILDEEGKIRKLSNKDCQFGYRESIFKEKPWVILEVTLKLKKRDPTESRRLAQEYLVRRQVPSYPSAGSIFKNIKVDQLPEVAKELIPVGKIKGGMVSSGYLIEECGLKGEQIGRAKISEEHANMIVNLGGAKAKDVMELIELCKAKVKGKFGIALEEEIRYVGDF